MEKHLVTGIFFAIFGVTYGQIFRQDYYYNQGAGGWLKFYPLSVKWEEAAMRCLDDGAILASPLDEEMRNALYTMMVEHGVTDTPMFTGISNVYAKSEYQSMEGVFLSNLNLCWSTEPSMLTLTSGNYCIAMNANGTVTAVSFSNPHPFVCYRKTGIELNECGPVDKGYTLDNRTGSCYKAVNKKVNWRKAFDFCAKEGAHLAIINSLAEAEVILELAKKVNNESPVAKYNYVSIGFYAWEVNQRSTWITIHGQSLVEAGYSKWAPNEPNRTDRCGAVAAGGVLADGILDDADCNYERKFICEIDLPRIPILL